MAAEQEFQAMISDSSSEVISDSLCTEKGKSEIVIGTNGFVPTEHISVKVIDGNAVENIECKVYKRRWIILFLFVVYSTSNAFQWIQYSIITNIIENYYGVDSFTVNWTSMIYMITYIPLIFPAAWLLDRKGLRIAVLIGSFGTALGAWIKVASTSPDRFYVTFAGQTVSAVSQIFILGIPANLAAVWFGPAQVSSACAIGVFGNQLGVATGFLFPPVLVHNHKDADGLVDKDAIGADLAVMFYIVSAITTTLFLLILAVFKARPPQPPSPAQAALVHREPDSYSRSILRLVKNRNYVLLLITYGMNVGVFYAISTLLNQVVLFHFPGREEDAGRIGLTIVISGMVGSVVCGIWLDKTHRFKETTLVVYALSLVGMLAYTFCQQSGYISVVYVMAGFLGFFMTGYLPLGFEFAAEITYPESEGTSSGLLNASAQFFGILCTMADSWLLENFGDLAANLALAAVLLVGTVFTAIIKADYRRQAAHHSRVRARIESEATGKMME